MPRDRRWLDRATTVLVLVGVWAFLLYYYKPSLLLLDTMDAGGDTPSFLRPIHHLKDVLLPAGNPQGWDLGNFAGYAPYQFYFLPPSLLIVALSYVVPFDVAFKLVSVLGVFLLPLTTTIALAALEFPFPVPALGAAASLLFLFNEGNSMWGGNIPSTLAGEFAHSISFALCVLFMGLLWRGVRRQRGWRGLGALLALTGLCHPIGFLNAAGCGIFFTLRREGFARNLRFLLLVYATAVLCMGFWIVPLVAKLPYATSINWVWHFNSVWDVLPPILYPAFVLAAVDAVWLVVRRHPDDARARYLLTAGVVSIVFFVNATEVGLPEIRFVPFVYLIVILLSVDLLARVLPLRIAPHLAAVALSAGLVAWTYAHVTFIPTWIKWNYEGLQRKASWPVLQGLMNTVRGTVRDPRVAYENSPLHDRFGSMRVFENMALLSGRSTLEGVLLQTAVNSPYIYWLQSQISKQGSGVIPGYSYPSLDIAHATPRLALYNVSDMIAVTPEVSKQLEADARWQRTLWMPPYSVWHLKDANPHYVRVPQFRPVLLDTPRWKKDFHRWFATDAALDVPIVALDGVPPGERARFAATVATSPTELPREPIDAGCQVDEHLDHMDIEFTTSCPGRPHIVKVAWFPNWHVEGASRIYLVSPGFMLVYPDGPHVRLTYRRVASDWIGLAMTAVGVGLCLVARRRSAPLGEPAAAVWRGLEAAWPALVGAGLVVVVGATAYDSVKDFIPPWFYQRGWKAFEAKDYPTAMRDFGWAIRLGGETATAADATFFRAASLLRAGQPADAMQGYLDVIARFPDSMWVAESHYHVGLCLRQLGRRAEAARKFQQVIDDYPGNRWAGFAKEQLDQMRAEPGGIPAS